MLAEVYSEFSQRLGHIGQPVLAGGSVRDHLMNRVAKDYDLFLLGNGYEQVPIGKVQEAIKDLPVVKTLEWHKSEPYLVVTVLWHGVDVQIMLNPATDVDELLNTFDWNVCLFAYDGHKFVNRESVDNIGLGNTLYLNNVRFPLSTLRRGFRFSERFGMILPRETVKLLCGKIVGNIDVGVVGNEPDMPSLAANWLIEA